MLSIVLLEPEIPPNTGNIVRTCAALGADLHLIEPLGFRVDDAAVKRAGLDYWDKANVRLYKNLADFYDKTGAEPFCWYASTKAGHPYFDAKYADPCYLVFGKETRGLPEDLLENNLDRCVRLPMREGIRSLNLSNSVAILAYEVMRQRGFPGLVYQGKFGVDGGSK